MIDTIILAVWAISWTALASVSIYAMIYAIRELIDIKHRRILKQRQEERNRKGSRYDL